MVRGGARWWPVAGGMHTAQACSAHLDSTQTPKISKVRRVGSRGQWIIVY